MAPLSVHRAGGGDITGTPDRSFNAFLSASEDLLAPLPRETLREVDGSLRGLLDVFEKHFYE